VNFALQKDEKPDDGIRRIIAERIDEAIHVLQPKPSKARGDRADVVHEARKRLKEIRAALRLVRDALGEKIFSRENHAFRDLARPLSQARDAQVLIDTLADLKNHFKDEISPPAFEPVRQALLRRRRETFDQGGAMATLAADLRSARARVDRWPLDDVDWGVISAGLKRVYRQGRDAMREALETREDAMLHEWRKRAKDLRYQLEILQPLWREVLSAMANQAHELGDHLGDDHDLAILSGLVDDELREVCPKPDRQALQALIIRRRKGLQKTAAALGRRLYAESPGAFVKRLHDYWRAGCMDGDSFLRGRGARPCVPTVILPARTNCDSY
jgi:CHAD domain-containing protein